MGKRINFLGLGISAGQPHRGPSLAIESIRALFPQFKEAGVEIIDRGDITSTEETHPVVYSAEALSRVDWTPYQKAQSEIRQLLAQGDPVLNWGGDHSVALSTVSAFCAENPQGYVLWIDAHADLNLPEQSLTGNIHGMPLSVLLNLEGVATKHFPWIGSYLNPQKLIYVGLRDVDFFERRMLSELNIKYYTAEEVRRLGMASVAQEILLLTQGYPLHVSFDIDSVSPEFAPATGLHVPNGLSDLDMKTLGAVLAQRTQITSLDVVEINPLVCSDLDTLRTNLLALQFASLVFSSTKVIQNGGIYDGARRADQAFDRT